MNEIEKLYKNAVIDYDERYNNCTLNKEGECKLKCSCDICKYSEEKYIYPPFTAKKQIELIKWLGELDYLGLMRTTMETKDWIFNSEYNMSGDIYKNSSRAKTFEETLAKLINTLWQDLIEEERKQIKDILEG